MCGTPHAAQPVCYVPETRGASDSTVYQNNPYGPDIQSCVTPAAMQPHWPLTPPSSAQWYSQPQVQPQQPLQPPPPPQHVAQQPPPAWHMPVPAPAPAPAPATSVAFMPPVAEEPVFPQGSWADQQPVPKQVETWSTTSDSSSSSPSYPLYIDRLFINERAESVRKTLEGYGLSVHHLEVMRGTRKALGDPPIHCSAYAVVSGDCGLTEGRMAELALEESAHELSGSGRPQPKFRVQRARRLRNVKPAPQRDTLHFRLFAHRESVAFAISSITWVGLATFLEAVSPGCTDNLLVVAESGSEHSRRCHPENLIVAFFLQCTDAASAGHLLQCCHDQHVSIDGESFLLAGEFTHDAVTNYDRLSPKAREDKMRVFREARDQAKGYAGLVRSGEYRVQLGNDPLFRFLTSEEVSPVKDWYRKKLDAIGYRPAPGFRAPGKTVARAPPINANDDILADVLSLAGLPGLRDDLAAKGVRSYHDFQVLLTTAELNDIQRRRLSGALHSIEPRVVGMAWS